MEVISAMDSFASYYPMYKLSPEKANFLKNTVKKVNPTNILEIGTFFGYSALNIASVMSPTCSLTCIEGNPENAEIARIMIKKAFGNNKAILNRINVVTGLSSAILQQDDVDICATLYKGNSIRAFDFVFFDHDKDCYLPDLLRLEKRHLLDENSCVLLADNVIYPGAPDYLSFVGYGPQNLNSESNTTKAKWRTNLFEFAFERKGYETNFQERKDAMSISYRL
jgi:predicted O-methyltransferase YrrM